MMKNKVGAMVNQIDYSDGKLLPLILKFSIPASISLLITAIYNIVDRIFVGNFATEQAVGNSTALASLSICFPISFMMMAVGLMCSAGGSTLFTLFRGKDQKKEANLSFSSSFLLTVALELVLTVVLLAFAEPILQLFGVTATTYDNALAYYKIVSIGCVFQGLTMIFCDYVRVSGKPIHGMVVTGIGAVTNIILDALFVAGFGWGVEGAAIATVIGQVVSVVYGSYMLFSGKTLVEIRKNSFKLDMAISKKLLNCGFAFFIAQMAMGFIALIYNTVLGQYGNDIAISVYAVIASIMTFVIMPASGISQGIQPLIGYNFSVGNYKRMWQIFTLSSILSVSITAIIWLIVEIFPGAIIALFGGGAELLEIGVPALRTNFIVTPILGFVMLATTFFQSIGKPAASSIITLIRQVLLLVPFIYILPIFWGLQGIFYAQPISDMLALLLSVFLILRYKRCVKLAMANA